MTGVDKLAVGDTITVKGYLTNYKGTIEFTSGCTCTKIEKQTLDYTVKAVSSDESKGTVSVSGYTITVTPANGYRYKDCSVTAGTASYTVSGNEITVSPSTNCTVTVNFEEKPVTAFPYAVGTAYRFAVNQKNLEGAPTLYFTGAKSGNYLATTRNVDEGVDIFLEAVDGGYRLYFMDGTTKTYIDIYEYKAGSLGIELRTEPTAVYTYNSELDIFTANVLDKDSYLGIYSNFETISRSDITYITGKNAANCDVTQHPARLVPAAPATTAKITYMANGKEYKTETVDLEKSFTLPTEAAQAPGYTFAGWTSDELAAETASAPSFVTETSVTKNTTFYAVYKKTDGGVDYYSTAPVSPYKVTAAVNDASFGTVTVEGLKITVTPADGYRYKSFEVTSGTAEASYENGVITVEPTSDCTVTVTFEVKPAVTLPYEVGTAYKFAVNQKNLEGAPTLYFTGAKSGNFLATTRNASEAADVYLEEAADGYRLYFMDGTTKTYIDIYEYQAGKLGIELRTEPTAVYTYNSELDIFTANVLDKDSYLGIYSNFETISRSDITYITGDNAANCDVTQHPARLVTVAPETPAKVTAVVSNTEGGSVSVNGYTITVTPAEGYVYKSHEVTSGTATATYANGVITVVPTSDCTVTVTFEAAVYANRVETFGDGAQIIIAIDGHVPTTETYDKGFKAAEGVFTADKKALAVAGNYLVLIVKEASQSGQFYLTTADGKYIACEATGNKLYTVSAPDAYSIWQYVNKGTAEAPVMVIENLNALYGSGDSAKKQGFEYYGGNFTVYGYAANNTKWTAYAADVYALTDRPLPQTVAITYVAKGETFDTANVEIGSTFTLPTEAPAFKGYTFAGWTAAEIADAETTTAPAFVTEATAEADTTYYAVYKRTTSPAPTYTDGALMNGAVVVITETTSDGAVYAMTNDNGSSNPPAAVHVEVNDNKITSEVPANLLWTVVAGADNTYSFKNGSDFLYGTDANNGLRVGDNKNNVFKFENEYLYNKAWNRFVGVYNKSDWRVYTSINNQIKDQTLRFFVQKLGEETSYYTTAPDTFTVTAEVNDPTFGTAEVDGYEITITPAPGYTLKDFVIAPEDAATYTEDGNKITLDPSADVTVTVNFKACDLIEEVSTLTNGSKVILVVGGNALTKEPGVKKGFVGAPAVLVDGKLAVEDSYMVLSVITGPQGVEFVDAATGKYLTSAATGNGMTLEDSSSEYSIWEILTKGEYTLVSNLKAEYVNTKTGVVSKQALEFYDNCIYPFSYNDSTTEYNIYGVKFYLAEEAPVIPAGPVSITYIANGSTVDTATVDGGSSFTLPTTAPAAEGYTFAGWTAAEITDETTEKPVLVTSAVATADATYYAVYTRSEEGTTGAYTKATSEADLAVGKKAIITAANANQALGSYGSSLFNQTGITKSNDKATLTDIGSANILTLAAGSTSGTWAFKSSDGKYIAITSTKNKAGEVASVNADASFTVTFGDKTTITASTYTWNLLCYNSGSPRFCFYASSSNQQPVDIYVFKLGAVDYYTTAPVAPAEPVIIAKANDAAYGSVTLEGNVITFTAADGYEYDGYTIAPDGAATATVDGGKITVTATADCTVTVNFKAIVPPTPEEIVTAAYALAKDATMDKEYTLTGVITAFNTLWDPAGENISVIMVVGDLTDKPIQCYQLTVADKSDEELGKLANLAIGDTITVTGVLKNENDTVRFGSGCILNNVVKGEDDPSRIPNTPEDIVEAAYNLAPGTILPYEYSLSGVVSEIITAWDDTAKNVSFSMIVPEMTTKPIQVLNMAASDPSDEEMLANLAALIGGDTVSVTGYLEKTADGTVRFVPACIGEYVPTGGGGGGEEPIIFCESADETQGTVSLTGNVITVTPAAGYQYKGYTVDPVDAATVLVDGNTLTVTEVTADCTITVSFEAIPVPPVVPTTVKVTFMANGTELSSEDVTPGEAFTLPATATAVTDYEFVGWVKEAIATETTTAPTVLTDSDTVSEDTIYYAVYKRTEEGTTGTYTKATSASDLAVGKKVVIASTTNGKTYALGAYNSSTYYNSVEVTRTGNTLTLATGVNELTLEAGSATGTWAFKGSDGKYIVITSTKNKAGQGTSVDANASVTVSFGDTNKIFTASTYTWSELQYNASSPRFAFYASSQKSADIYVYKTDTVDYFTTSAGTSPAVPPVEEEYTVTAAVNDETFGTATAEGNVIFFGAAEGYQYKDYTITPDGAATAEVDGNQITVTATADCTVTVNFEAITVPPVVPTTVKVTFIANGETISSLDLDPEEVFDIPASATAAEGYEFIGWVTSQISEDTQFDSHDMPSTIASDTYAVSEDTTFYALYKHEVKGEGTWKLVTAASQLTEGSKVVIAGKTSNKALGSLNGAVGAAGYMNPVDITRSSDKTTITFAATAGVNELTLEKGATAGTWAFYDQATKAYLAACSSKNKNTEKTTKDADSSWTVTVSSSATSVVSTTSSIYNTLSYNTGSPRFTCYSNTSQEGVVLFIYTAGESSTTYIAK